MSLLQKLRNTTKSGFSSSNSVAPVSGNTREVRPANPDATVKSAIESAHSSVDSQHHNQPSSTHQVSKSTTVAASDKTSSTLSSTSDATRVSRNDPPSSTKPVASFTTSSTPQPTLPNTTVSQSSNKNVLTDISSSSQINASVANPPGVGSPSIQKIMKQHKYNLSEFHVDRTLGTGSFGRVHMVKLKSNGKHFAMKVLRKSEVVRMKQVEHTVNEKSILEQLDFPFLVSLLGTFQDSHNVYFVMEYVQGGELFTYLRRCGRFPNNVARFYAAEVICAFEYLHSKDMIYRDLKPENLLIDSQGHIKITDFGFAKHVPDVTWTLCGTPDYLAPEIIQSKGYGRAVDWWALGVLIYEMLAGHPPFYDEDHFKLYEKILACKPRFPTHFDPNAKDLVKRLLTSDLTKRFGNLRGGSGDIKRHKWFLGLEWTKLVKLQVAAPYIPPLKSEGDTSNFESYPEDHEQYGLPGPDPHRDKFKDF